MPLGRINILDEELHEAPIQEVQRGISACLREKIFRICLGAKEKGSHIGGPSSSVEIMTALYLGGFLNINLENPLDPDRDRVLVRGHMGPLRYSLFSLMGFIGDDELDGYRDFGSRLHGHESMFTTPGVDISPSGSLGMILSYGVGCAVAGRNQGKAFKTVVFLGDGEEQEGNVSEAARNAANLKLDNLVCIIDKNGKQLSRPVDDFNSETDVKKVWEGYGWEVVEISDGHDYSEIAQKYQRMDEKREKPLLIIANTVKGNMLEGAEDHFSGYHTTSTIDKKRLEQGLEIQIRILEESGMTAEKIKQLLDAHGRLEAPFQIDEAVADSTHMDINLKPKDRLKSLNAVLPAYGRQLGDIFEKEGTPNMYYITADVFRTDHIKASGIQSYAKCLDVGIREQHMMAMAYGISVTDPNARIMIKNMDSFTYRFMDQLNAAAQGKCNMVILGSASGLSNDYNGPTHQSIGQTSAVLSIPGVKVLEPGDATDFYNCLNEAFSENKGITYIRIHNCGTEEVESVSHGEKNTEHYVAFEPKSKVNIVLVSSGLTLQQSIEAAKKLEAQGIGARVINAVSLSSLRSEEFLNLLEANIPVLAPYNGHPETLQGLIASTAMRSGKNMPSSVHGHGFLQGTTGDIKSLLGHYQLDADGIVQRATEILKGSA